ncbi:MAG TPA: DUF503 domain-containing protein [Longilinea sp.]|nr:DUF503 domain-containing protein [Longilinea sp.]
MDATAITQLTLLIEIPGCLSLKDKRSQIKPLLIRLHQKFNISAAEIDHLDQHKTTVIACILVSNDARHNQQVLQQVVDYIENSFPELLIQQHRIENI